MAENLNEEKLLGGENIYLQYTVCVFFLFLIFLNLLSFYLSANPNYILIIIGTVLFFLVTVYLFSFSYEVSISRKEFIFKNLLNKEIRKPLNSFLSVEYSGLYYKPYKINFNDNSSFKYNFNYKLSFGNYFGYYGWKIAKIEEERIRQIIEKLKQNAD